MIIKEMKEILIIDDDKSITDMLKAFLSSQYEVVTANNGLKALSTAREFAPNLIILELILPGISGYGIASKIENDSALKGTPIVYITGQLKRKEETDIDDRIFIANPIDFRKLINTIESDL